MKGVRYLARPLIGCWPKGKDIDEIIRLESSLKIKFDMRRERGGRGRLDSVLYKSTDFFTGVHGSFDLQSRVGEAPNVRPVPFDEIVQGKWDTTLDLYCTQFGELQSAGVVPLNIIEFQSEANVVNDAQPGPPWFEGGAESFIYVAKFFRSRGVRRRDLKFVLSVSRGVFNNFDTADKYYLPLIQAGVLDIIGVDAYDHTFEGGKSRSFIDCFAPAVAYAKTKNMEMGICETGVGEDPNDENYKANWYRDAFSWINVTKRSTCRFVCFSGEDPWVMDSSPQAAAAFVAGMTEA